MAVNIFASKKKDPKANMSYMGQSVYSQPTTTQKTPFIQTSGRSFLGIPEKVTIGGKRQVTQPVAQPTQQSKPVTQISVNGKIPASGMGSQYANQTITKPTTTVETPKVQSAAEKYMANIKALGEKQQLAAKQRALDTEKSLKDRYKNANEELGLQVPELDTELQNFKNTEAAGLLEAKKAAEAQKQTTSDYYGEAQRLAAQTRNETRGQTGRVFANLGTIDSRGEGSYQQGMENIDTEFNRETQKRLNEKAARLSDIDSTYYKAEVASNNAIRTKEAEKTKLVRQIKLAQQQNNLDLADKLTAAWQVADDAVTEIENNLMQLKYASEQETEKTQRELDQLKGLSESFLTTGKPSTMNDMLYIKDNPDFAKAIASVGGTGKMTEKQQAYNAAGQIAQNALSKLRAGGVYTGIGGKTMGSAGELLGFNSPTQQAYRSDIAAMRTAIQNALLGANMSPKEMEQVMAAIPQYSDAPNIAEDKLNALIRNLPIMAGQSGSITSGGLTNEQITQIMSSL